MTREGLVRLGLAVFGVCAVAAAVWRPVALRYGGVRSIRSTYGALGLKAGERALVRHLERDPGDAEGWLLLVQMRGAILAPEMSGEGDEGWGDGDAGDGEDGDWDGWDGSGSGAAEFLEPFLSEETFETFLETAADPEPAELLARYRYRRVGRSAGLAGLAAMSDAGRRAMVRGEFLAAEGDVDGADAAFREAVRLGPGNRRARRQHLALLQGAKRDEAVDTLLEDAGYRAVTDPDFLTDFAVRRQRYGLMAWSLLLWQWESLHRDWGMTAAALAMGLCWVVFVVHLGNAWKEPWRFWAVASAAVLLGAASTWPTLVWVVLQDHWLPPEQHQGDLLFQLFFYVAGVGLREEVCKAVMVLPLLPYLVRCRERLQILTITSLVGLGFAMEENVNYFLASGGTAVVARFLTANFFHMVMTGCIGYHLVEACRMGGERYWNRFWLEAGKMILAHGMYDFLLGLGDLSFVGMAVFVYLAQQYLRLMIETGSMRGRRPMPVTRLFVIVIALGAGITFILLTGYMGAWEGLRVTCYSMLGVGVITIVFFTEFREPVG